ncbi:MAG: PAS domain S-box protein [Spirochaetes bacterium]|nr:PAS domain S-box protein [Spirochaetota bacterium]
MTPDRKKKILIVDDEAIIAMSESRMLEKNGYRVLTAHSGEDAVRKAAEQPDLDLVLMDIDLGAGMDGTQAAEIILKTRDIPVLFLSSHNEPEIVDKTEKITSYGYVVKNSGETVILASIKMAFKLHSAHQELRKREEELGKSQWKLNFIFENTPSAITVTEMETGIVVEANKGVEWTGWTKEDVIGKSPQMLQTWVLPDEGERIRNIIKTEGKLANHRVDFYKKDGSIAHVLMSSVFLNMDGRQYLLTVSNDITRLTEFEMELRSAKTDLEAMNEELNATVEELEATNEELQATIAEVEETKKELELSLVEVKKTEEALRLKNLLLTTQQETSIDGILVVGESGTILSYNSRFADMWGMPADILSAGSDKAAMDNILDKLASPEQFLEKVSHLYAHRSETSKDELIFKDGRIFDRFSSPMFDRHGTYHGRVWYFRDITDQKRAAEALKESEEQYRTLVDNMQDVMYRCDLKGRITFATPSAAVILGCPSVEWMIGKNLKDFYINPEESVKQGEILKERGTYKQYEATLRRVDNGAPVNVLVNSQFYRDRNGTIIGVEGVLTDITERKRVEDALRESEELYRTLFENSATANIIAAADTTILLANSNFVKLIGYSREEMEGRMSWTSFILDEYVEKMKAYHLQRIKESGNPPQAYEFKARMRSGEVRDFYMNVAMIPGSANSLGTIIDITDRARMEEQLKRSEERFSDLVRFLPETVYEADRQGRITYVNQTGLEQFGYTQGDIDRGLNVLSIIAPRSQKQAIEKIARILQGEHLSLNEYMAQKKDGTTFPALVHSSVIYRDGQPDGFRGFLADITEIKLAERSLNESENRYRRVIHSIPIGIHLYRLEADGRLVFDGANPAADSILGVDNSIFIGKTIEEAFPALTATEAPRRYREAAEKGVSWHTEQIDYDENEIRGAFDVLAFRIGDRLMAAAFTDITDRKKTEKALLDNQRLLNTVYDNVGAYIFMKDTSYRYTFANKKCCELFGRDLPDIIGRTDAEFFSADSIPEIMISDRRVIEEGETVTREETNLASPGGTRRRTYWTVKIPLRDSGGAIYALCGISTDITERKQAEEALRESEERWQFALEGSGDGLWDWNAQTDKVYFSRQWKAMLGYDTNEIGDTLSEWESRVHPDDRDRVHGEINKHFEGVIPVYTSEHRMKCKNGEYKWILDRGKVISRTPEGKPLRVIGTHTDITILKAIQEALGKTVTEKEALLRELQHRMKNSLALITSIINLEIERFRDKDLAGVLDNIKGRIESLSSLYALLFQSDTFKEVDLGDYLKSIINLLSGSYGTASSSIRIEEELERLRVNAKNAAAWGLIANELLTNSYKYAFPEGGAGTIRINLKKQKGEIILAISDNGRGLPADFDIDNPSGLGLLLVKTLTLQLKGTLTLERGRETVFQVRASVSSES